MHPHTQPLRRMRTAQEHHNACGAVVAEEAGKAVWESRQTGWGGWAGQVAGRVGWLAGSGGWQGLVACQIVGRRSSE